MREVGLTLIMPPAECVLVPATAMPNCETRYRIAVYGDSSEIRLDHVDEQR